ncbi:hypothetical protein DVH24_036157 [Malus domestica]|uniref:NADH:quinone oxidoreductase/Mrp antiporter transmembrane domain-containing protein n=1 Tax=Malus domestica TaxID=3750 RepID=A0A498IEG0_MALDO|nr:hypothetical protein DVH24_036157 [Malus domestica]
MPFFLSPPSTTVGWFPPNRRWRSPRISIALIFITVGIGFKLSPAPSHQWTPDVYEGARISNNESLYCVNDFSVSETQEFFSVFDFQEEEERKERCLTGGFESSGQDNLVLRI